MSVRAKIKLAYQEFLTQAALIGRDHLLDKMKGTKSNVEFLIQIQKTTISDNENSGSSSVNGN